MTALPPPVARRSVLVGAAALSLAGTTTAALADSGVSRPPLHERPGPISRRVIRRWAADTWASLVAMTDERTGLTADNIDGPIDRPNRSGYTSPTNIGGYLWSTVVAHALGLISGRERTGRLRQTLGTLESMHHHEPSGMFFNWYDESNGEVLTSWPTDGKTVYPFLSSVDNGWLAAALLVVSHADRHVARRAARLFDRFRFLAYYNPEPRPDLATGLLRGGFWLEPPPDTESQEGNHLGDGADVFYTLNHYDTTVSETRIASYLGIASGEIPPEHYFGTWRTFPDGCDWAWQEQRPVGVTRSYLGIDVYEGTYSYRGSRIVPGWGGSMFEALMPDVFVPEAAWAPRSWGINHRLTVRAQREFGLHDAGYGYWGFSPASLPGGGYHEWGVDALGLNPDGYPSDLELTSYDGGYDGCREGTNPDPAWGDGVVTPHAAFLAMQHEPRAAYTNLVRLQRDLDVYGDGGFYDAVAVKSGLVARRYLSLDQAMIMGALGNVFADQVIRRHFVAGDVTRRIKPLIGLERFGAGGPGLR